MSTLSKIILNVSIGASGFLIGWLVIGEFLFGWALPKLYNWAFPIVCQGHRMHQWEHVDTIGHGYLGSEYVHRCRRCGDQMTTWPSER